MMMFIQCEGRVYSVKLLIENELHEFIPIQQFRDTFEMSHEFGVSLFAPKDFTGLGRIDTAGGELKTVRAAMLDAIPSALPVSEWLDYLPHLTRLFQNKLDEINPAVGLKTVEIDYAVSGFTDVCQAVIYTIIRSRSQKTEIPSFYSIHSEWLNSTVQVLPTVHHHIHRGEIWAVQVVVHAYGRAGLIVWTDTQTYYLHDNALGCPAEGFMAALLTETALKIIASTQAFDKTMKAETD